MDSNESQLKAFGEIEQLIKEGHLIEAQHRINDLSRPGISRSGRLRLASLARRTHLYNVALRLLIPIVRPKKRKIGESPTDEEMTEYSASLIRLGAIEEALSILNKVNGKSVPDSLLFKAIALFAKWDYAGAVPILKQYVESNSITPYLRLVGKVNLVSALIHEGEVEEAEQLLKSLKEETKRENLNFLYGKLKYFAAELEITKKNYQGAIEFVKVAKHELINATELDKLLLDAWEVIAEMGMEPKSRSVEKKVIEIKKKAVELRHYETIRNIDLHQAVFLKDKELFLHLCAGTPHEAFRSYLGNKIGLKVVLPEKYDWVLNEEKKNNILDVDLKAGTTLYRLFVVLTSDFYTAFRSVELYAKVFPNNSYNPDTSPYQIRQCIKLLRAWLVKNKIPLEIEHHHHAYRLIGSGTLAVSLSRVNTESEKILKLLKDHFNTSFSAKEAYSLLKRKRRTMIRILTEATKAGVLSRSGKGPSTRYEFIEMQELKKAS